MSKFLKPGSDQSYIEFGSQAVRRALLDSGIAYKEIEEAMVGYVLNSSCAGQRVLYEVGMSGIPVTNLNNNCATGSTAFNLCVKLVKSGSVNCALALGFDQMKKGPLQMEGENPNHPVFNYVKPLIEEGRLNMKIPLTPQIFGAAGKEHIDRYGTTKSHLAKISVKNYAHGLNNPYAQFQKKYTEKDVLESPMVSDPLTKLQCCPTSDGAAAIIVASEEFVLKHNLQDQAVEVLSSVLCSDREPTFVGNSYINIIGSDLCKFTAQKAYKEAGVSPNDIQVIELHDCFSANELVTYEGLGLCPEGKAKEFIDRGDNTYGGKYVVNPSGGLTSKGHPLGATGLAQLTELTWQLRKMAEKRQVKNAKIALAHNLGLGSAIVVSILKKYNDNFNVKEHQSSDPKVIEKYEDKVYVHSPKPKF
jgi:sterol carrier protein 2